MRIRRTVIVFMVTLLVVLALAGPASAGGRVEAHPLPGWLETAIVVALLVVGRSTCWWSPSGSRPGDGISRRSSPHSSEPSAGEEDRRTGTVPPQAGTELFAKRS
jgi:hypothetical protein